MNVGEKIEVLITKITLGKDGWYYVTITHPKARNYPTLVMEKTE